MNNEPTYIHNNSEIHLFRPYVPYVFVSDHPSITNDADAAKRWLDQQADPTLEPLVKIYPVSPPQVSIQTYIEGMYKIISKGSTNEPYGNDYTPYRILQAILNSAHKDKILSPLDSELRQQLVKVISELDRLKSITPQNANEFNLDYKERLAKVQNEYMRSQINQGQTVSQWLRRTLLKTCMYDPMGTDERGNQEIINLISQVCKDSGITGVLCKPKFMAGQKGQAVGGFAYKVAV